MLYLLIWIYPSVWCSHSKIRADQPRLLKVWASAVSHAFVWSTVQSRVNQPLFSIQSIGNKKMLRGFPFESHKVTTCQSLWELTDPKVSPLLLLFYNHLIWITVKQLDNRPKTVFSAMNITTSVSMSTHNTIGSFISVSHITLMTCSGKNAYSSYWSRMVLLAREQQLQLPTILCFHTDHCQAS